jgi:hypothetical protein
MLGVTVTKSFREHARAFFFEHLYASLAGEKPPLSLIPETPAAAPTLPADPSKIPPPTSTPMSN